jgi:hypothetical protein
MLTGRYERSIAMFEQNEQLIRKYHDEVPITSRDRISNA